MSKRVTESQRMAVLKEAKTNMLIKDVCRIHNITNSTLYK